MIETIEEAREAAQEWANRTGVAAYIVAAIRNPEWFMVVGAIAAASANKVYEVINPE